MGYLADLIQKALFMKKEANGILIEIRKGDITNQNDVEAIVNAANAQLLSGGGVAGAIHNAAGPELVKEAEPLGPINPGEAVLTKAYNLPNKYVIHCLGPVYGVDKPEDKLLAQCYINALSLADREGIKSVAFPAISTGAFGFPAQKAAPVAIKTITDQTQKLKNVKTIIMVLYGMPDFELNVEILNQTI